MTNRTLPRFHGGFPIGLAYPHIFQALFADWKETKLPIAGPTTVDKQS